MGCWGWNWATSPAITPPRTSPLPAVAMPGLPVWLTHTRPAGVAVRV